VDGTVEGAVAVAVEPVPYGLAAAGRDRAGAAEGVWHCSILPLPSRQAPILPWKIRIKVERPQRSEDVRPW